MRSSLRKNELLKTAHMVPMLFAAVTLLPFAAVSAENFAPPPPLEARIGLGVKSLPSVGMFGFLPVPISVGANLDVGRFFRLHGEFTYHLMSIIRPSLGAGAAFTLYGTGAPKKEGFQLKLPVIGETGFMIANHIESGDGHGDERIRWFVLGASSGLDFTWWFAGKAGLWVTLTGGYMFRVDMGSDYVDGYSTVEDAIGTPEAALLIGAAF